MVILPNAQRRALIDELIAAGQLLDGLTIHLYKNDVEPSPTMIVGDFTEADFTGYVASGVVVWGATYTDPTDNAVTVGDVKQFTASGSAVQNLIYGYMAKDGAALVMAERFPTPIPIAALGDAVVMVPRFTFGQ